MSRVPRRKVPPRPCGCFIGPSRPGDDSTFLLPLSLVTARSCTASDTRTPTPIVALVFPPSVRSFARSLFLPRFRVFDWLPIHVRPRAIKHSHGDNQGRHADPRTFVYRFLAGREGRGNGCYVGLKVCGVARKSSSSRRECASFWSVACFESLSAQVSLKESRCFGQEGGELSYSQIEIFGIFNGRRRIVHRDRTWQRKRKLCDARLNDRTCVFCCLVSRL